MLKLSTTALHTHVVFADESGYNCGRYRAIAAVSTTVERATLANYRISKILTERNVREMKWQDVRSNHKRDCAIKLLRNACIESLIGDFRVDVLGWDTQDSRHSVRSRDDLINLEKMYYHLCHNIMQKRWKPAEWHIHPDENTALDWGRVRDTLYYRSFNRNYVIEGLTPVDSSFTPLVQVADLFAGLMVYSKEAAEPYDSWRRWYKAVKSGEMIEATPKPSGSVRARSELLNKLIQWRNERPTLGFALERAKGLHTLDPRSPINFWWYRPQRDSDKAPTKLLLAG